MCQNWKKNTKEKRKPKRMTSNLPGKYTDYESPTMTHTELKLN